MVKNITEWGAFIDLNGVDSLLHITDISWSRINKPSELLAVGQSIKVKIIKIEPKSKKISVSIKHLTEDPYAKIINKYEVGKKYSAVVTKVQDYGCFAKLEEGLEGLIHQSELSWTKKNIHPGKVLSTSQKIEVELLEKDIEKRRLSLSYKNTLVNPWVKFTQDHKVGDVYEGTIKNITDYALFIAIKNTELDGMIHYKDLDHSEKDSELGKYKKNQLAKEIENQRPSRFVKGDKLDALISELDKEKRKVSLSIKALEEKQTKEAVKKYGSKDSGGILSDIFDFSKVKTKSKIKK